jgi:hypothetical protein
MSGKSRNKFEEPVKARKLRLYMEKLKGERKKSDRLNDKGQVKKLAKLYPKQFDKCEGAFQ